MIQYSLKLNGNIQMMSADVTCLGEVALAVCIMSFLVGCFFFCCYWDISAEDTRPRVAPIAFHFILAQTSLLENRRKRTCIE